MWGNIVAPMVIGFAADKLMGGSGVKGAIAGGTMGYGAGKPGAVAGGSNIPAHLISDPTIAATAIPGGGGAIHTAAGARGIPSNAGNITGLFDNWSNPVDFIKDGFSDMTFADQLGVGMQAEGLLNRPTAQMQVPDIAIDDRPQTPTLATPLITQIQGIQMPEEEKLRQQYSNRPNFYG
jgi:hypothetical protein